MRISELLGLVRTNALQNKGRVLLTSLGIIVGTAAIVLVTAIGQDAKDEAETQYSGMSADTIFVNLDYQQMQDSFDSLCVRHPHKRGVRLLSRLESILPETGGCFEL